MKFIFTLLTLLFTLTVGAQETLPPVEVIGPSTGPHGMPICYSGCFAGCSPISPSCQAKNLGIIEQAIEDEYGIDNLINLKPMSESVTIIKDYTIDITKFSKNKVSNTTINMLNGHYSYLSQGKDGLVDNEYWLEPVDEKTLSLFDDLDTQVTVGSMENFQKVNCGAKRTAFKAAESAMDAAEETGDAELIQQSRNLFAAAAGLYARCLQL